MMKQQQIANQQRQQQQQWFQQLLDKEQKLPADYLHWLHALREDARQTLKTSPVLNRKREDWRYDRVESIFKQTFDSRIAIAGTFNDYEAALARLPATNSHRLVFVNSCFAPDLSAIHDLPAGVQLMSLNEAMYSVPEQLAAYFNDPSGVAKNPFNALNTALFNDGVYLNIAAGVSVQRPIEIVYLSTSQATDNTHAGAMLQSRNLLVLQKESSASVLEIFMDVSVNPLAPSHYFNNHLSTIYLDKQAQLQHVRIQNESRQASHLSSVNILQRQQSQYKNSSVALGAAWSKTEYRVDFLQPQASCDLQGLYAVGDQQLTDFHLDVQHRVGESQSRANYRGLLYGKGRAVFDGRILVGQQAQHSDASLVNDNLVLVNSAEIDSKPQLEIYADDVKCSHGTTVGKLDSQQLFYLRSRGISEINARSLLCQGFAAAIIENIEPSQWQDYLMGMVLTGLKDMTQDALSHDGD